MMNDLVLIVSLTYHRKRVGLGACDDLWKRDNGSASFDEVASVDGMGCVHACSLLVVGRIGFVVFKRGQSEMTSSRFSRNGVVTGVLPRNYSVDSVKGVVLRCREMQNLQNTLLLLVSGLLLGSPAVGC